MRDFSVKVLTVEEHVYRNYMLLSHLETIGFPVMDMMVEADLNFYNGFYYKNFASNVDLLRTLASKGYSGFNDILNRTPSDESPNIFMAVEGGMMRIMEKVVAENRTSLVLESDACFNDVGYDDIVEQWKALVDLEGYENIKIAQLTHGIPLTGLKEATPITDFWSKGVIGNGQVANFYTPHGAQYLLDREQYQPTIENWLVDYNETPGFYTVTKSCWMRDTFSNFVYTANPGKGYGLDYLHVAAKGEPL